MPMPKQDLQEFIDELKHEMKTIQPIPSAPYDVGYFDALSNVIERIEEIKIGRGE